MSTQKQSLLTGIPLDSYNGELGEYRVFLLVDSKLQSITISNESITIKEAIIESIHKFNQKYQLNNIADVSMYELYGARKSGKKKDDLPAFQKNQILKNTCLKNFYLMPLYYSPKLQGKDSSKSIQTQISIQSKSKNEVVENSLFGCFCLRKGSML